MNQDNKFVIFLALVFAFSFNFIVLRAILPYMFSSTNDIMVLSGFIVGFVCFIVDAFLVYLFYKWS